MGKSLYPKAMIAFTAVFLAVGIAEGDNQPPVIHYVEGAPEDVFINPLQAKVNATDPEGGDLKYVWRLDGKIISNGDNVSYNLMPGRRNLSLEVSDPDGGSAWAYWEIAVEPPPGWGEVADNDWNRTFFWSVFGLSGLGLAALAAIILFRRPGRGKGIDRRNDDPT